MAAGQGVLNFVVVVAGAHSVVVLHQAWVAHSPVGGWRAHTAAGFLHDDGQDEARVDVCCGRDGLDGGVDGVDFGPGVVGLRLLRTRAGHHCLVIVEPGWDVGEGLSLSVAVWDTHM